MPETGMLLEEIQSTVYSDVEKLEQEILDTQEQQDVSESVSNMGQAAEGAEKSLGQFGKTLDRVGQSGVFQKLGDIVGQNAQIVVGSTAGQGAGRMLGNVVSMAGQGAAIGTMIFPTGVSAGIGAGVGALLGVITSGVEIFIQDEGERLQSYVQQQYNSIQLQRQQMLENGSQLAAQQELQQMAGGEQADNSSYLGVQSALKEKQNEMDSAMGQGYNEVRKMGMQQEMDFLSSETGDQMAQMYAYMGQFQASLENKKEEYVREAMTAMVDGTSSDLFSQEVQQQLSVLHEEYTQYAQAAESGDMEAQAQLGRILAETQVLAQIEYQQSEGENIRVQAELELVEDMQEDVVLTKAYYNAGYRLGQKMGDGIIEAQKRANIDQAAQVALEMGDEEGYRLLMGEEAPGRAMGETRVPHDNSLYVLHEGEKVLTASQARAYDSSGGIEPLTDLDGMMEMGMPFEMERTTTTTVTDWPAPTPGTAQGAGGSAGTGGVTVTITGNEFVVRNERDIDAIAQAFVQKIQAAAMVT